MDEEPLTAIKQYPDSAAEIRQTTEPAIFANIRTELLALA
jgi:hypothetical protein